MFSSSSPKRSSNEPLINPESILGICGSSGLDGHGGLDRMSDGGRVLIKGGEERISGRVSAGLGFRSGEGPTDSIEYLTWSSGNSTGG